MIVDPAQSQTFLQRAADVADVSIKALAALGLFLYAIVRLGLDAF
jgi:hypothetical protein